MQPRRAGRKTVLVVALAGALLLGELGLHAGAALTGRERAYDFDAVLGWRMLPHVEKRNATWGATRPGRTNAHGWRDRERAFEKPPGERRLAVLGDSFAFGEGVDAEARFTDVVERGTGWAVLNFGCCGYGTDQQLLAYEHRAAAFAPDAVLLVVFLGNDFDDIRCDRQSGWSKPWFRLRDGSLELVPPVADWTVALRTRSYLVEVALQSLHPTPAARTAEEWSGREALPLFVALVRALQAATRRRGAALLVMLAQPCDEALRPVRLAATDDVLAALRRENVDVFDTWDAVAAVADVPAYRHDGHWSAAGHAAVAGALLAELTRRPWFAR